jgi:hypothetical protein
MLPDHPTKEIALIGEIDFSQSINESEIGNQNSRFSIKKVGPCKIEVYNGEGQIPHFYITGIGKKFNCCVRIYDAHFFSHGNKYRDTLNSSQCNDLNNWLMQINSKMAVPMTNWQAIKSLWETLNSDCKYPEKLKTTSQPDYSKMSLFRDEI